MNKTVKTTVQKPSKNSRATVTRTVVESSKKAKKNKMPKRLKIPRLFRQNGRYQRKSVLSMIGLDAQAVEHGTEELIDSLFVGIHNQSRGVAFGTEPSALCTLKNLYDFTIPAGGVMNFIFTPFALASANWGTFQTATALAPQIVPGSNPYTTGTGITQTAIAGPFTVVNPSTAFRVTAFHLKITPTTNVLNQGGYVNFAHIPCVNTTNAPPSGVYSGPTTSAELEGQVIQRVFTGMDSIWYNWFPGPNELEFVPGTTTTTGVFSGPYGSVVNMNGAPIGVHIEVKTVVEILPNTLYVQFVDKQPAKIHPNAYYHMNQFVCKHWQPAVLATQPEWEAMVNRLDPIANITSDVAKVSNSIGIPNRNAFVPMMYEKKLLRRGVDWEDFGEDDYTITSGGVKRETDLGGQFEIEIPRYKSGWRNY